MGNHWITRLVAPAIIVALISFVAVPSGIAQEGEGGGGQRAKSPRVDAADSAAFGWHTESGVGRP